MNLEMPIKFPAGYLIDIISFVQTQNLYIYLYDVSFGAESTTSRLIGSASIPLIRVLLATHAATALALTLRMGRPDTLFPDIEARLKIEVKDDCPHELFHFSRLYEKSVAPGEVWLLNTFSDKKDKEKQPLIQVETEGSSEAEKAEEKAVQELQAALLASGLSKEVFDTYIQVKKALRRGYPSRTYPSVAKDEFGNLAFLPCFVQPIKTPAIVDIKEASRFVASLGQHARTGKYLIESQHLLETEEGSLEMGILPEDIQLWRKLLAMQKVEGEVKCTSGVWSCLHTLRDELTPEGELLSPGVFQRKAGLRHPANIFSHDYRGCIVSIDTTVGVTKRASLMERAILLADLLMGLGHNAFVVLGTGQSLDFLSVSNLSSSFASLHLGNYNPERRPTKGKEKKSHDKIWY